MDDISREEAETLRLRLEREAREGGYNLTPDTEFARELASGLLVNERRYGYLACPCRLAAGTREDDLDIICPCDYRDADISEYGACYCALYVSAAIAKGEREARPIPERRPPPGARKEKKQAALDLSGVAYPVWRCRVCGYLCARDQPPEVCPVCKAKKDRFEKFI